MFELIDLINKILNVNNPYINYDPAYDYDEADGENFKPGPFNWLDETDFKYKLEDFIEERKIRRKDNGGNFTGAKNQKMTFLNNPAPVFNFTNEQNQNQNNLKEKHISYNSNNFQNNKTENYYTNPEKQVTTKEVVNFLKLLETKEVTQKIKEIQTEAIGVNLSNSLKKEALKNSNINEFNSDTFGFELSKALSDAQLNRTIAQGY